MIVLNLDPASHTMLLHLETVTRDNNALDSTTTYHQCLNIVPPVYLLIEEMMKDSKYLTQMNPVDIVENLVDEILTLNN